MPATEVSGWQAFYQMQPFGPWRDNYHSAQIAYILAAANRDPKRAAPQMSEFMYKDNTTRKRESDAATVLFFDSKVK